MNKDEIKAIIDLLPHESKNILVLLLKMKQPIPLNSIKSKLEYTEFDSILYLKTLIVSGILKIFCQDNKKYLEIQDQVNVALIMQESIVKS